MTKLIRTVLYKFGFIHHDNVISGVLSGSDEIGSAVDGYIVWPAINGDNEVHVEFTGTVVDPDAEVDDEPRCTCCHDMSAHPLGVCLESCACQQFVAEVTP